VSPPGVSALEHVLVLSDDIEATRAFYDGVLGLRIGDRPPLEFPGYWLYAGDTACVHVAARREYAAHATLVGLAVPERASGPGPVDHIAFTAEDYDGMVDRLERHGVAAVLNTVPGGGPRQLFFDDPNGVRIEINVTTPTQAR